MRIAIFTSLPSIITFLLLHLDVLVNKGKVMVVPTERHFDRSDYSILKHTEKEEIFKYAQK